MIRGGAAKKSTARKSKSRAMAKDKAVDVRSKRKSVSKGTPIEEELRFKPFKEPPSGLEISGSKHGLNGKWKLLKSFTKNNYQVHVYTMGGDDSGPYLAIVRGGYADKATGVWREKWFWSITQSNPLAGDMLENYLKTNFWSPKDMLNGGLLKGSHVYRFEFREILEKIKNDDSREIRFKIGGRKHYPHYIGSSSRSSSSRRSRRSRRGRK